MNAIRAASMSAAALFFLPLCASAQMMPDRDPYNQPFAPRDCDRCDDLCALVDQYWQKERGIEIWKRYAHSNLSRVSPPATVTDVESLQNHVKEELGNAMQGRNLPCKTLQEAEAERGNTNPEPPRNPIQTGLETKVFLESCEIVYRGEKVQDVTEKVWRSTHVCKGSADAELAHEQVHQRICQSFWTADRSRAVQRQSRLRDRRRERVASLAAAPQPAPGRNPQACQQLRMGTDGSAEARSQCGALGDSRPGPCRRRSGERRRSKRSTALPDEGVT